MPPRRAGAEDAATCLLRAMRAPTREEKSAWATRGLGRVDDDPEMTALLLRQRYLAEMDGGLFEEALGTAGEMIAHEELGDIARQDAARAALGLNLVDVAVDHLRIAARICPASRRAFHLATLGALLRFGGKPDDAVEAFARACRSATKDRVFYQAQLVLAERAAERPLSAALENLREGLEHCEVERGYTLLILGEVCALQGDHPASRRYLTSFLERLTDAPRAKALALRGEIALAKDLLQKVSA